MGVPIFVTRVKVGIGRDMIMISAESPSGDTSKGAVENQETVRLVMSPSTFAEVTQLFVRTLKGFDDEQLRSHLQPNQPENFTMSGTARKH